MGSSPRMILRPLDVRCFNCGGFSEHISKSCLKNRTTPFHTPTTFSSSLYIRSPLLPDRQLSSGLDCEELEDKLPDLITRLQERLPDLIQITPKEKLEMPAEREVPPGVGHSKVFAVLKTLILTPVFLVILLLILYQISTYPHLLDWRIPNRKAETKEYISYPRQNCLTGEHVRELKGRIHNLEQKCTGAYSKDRASSVEGANSHDVVDDARSVNSGLQEARKYKFSRQDIVDIVEDAISRYQVDSVGMPDYALESAGGSIVDTPGTEAYDETTCLTTFWGLPLRFQKVSARRILQPTVHPGECWAFKGSHGNIVIQLSYPIRVMAFTVDHIHPQISPTGKIDSSPRDFEVVGLKHETDVEGFSFGNYIYSDNGKPTQVFRVQRHSDTLFEFIKLKVYSNNGHPKYTCIYRFRVHGNIMEDPNNRIMG